MKVILKAVSALVGVIAVAIVAARIVFALPQVVDRVDSTAIAPPAAAPLVASVQAQWENHPDKTGVAALGRGADAFAARMIFADAATSSIDAPSKSFSYSSVVVPFCKISRLKSRRRL